MLEMGDRGSMLGFSFSSVSSSILICIPIKRFPVCVKENSLLAHVTQNGCKTSKQAQKEGGLCYSHHLSTKPTGDQKYISLTNPGKSNYILCVQVGALTEQVIEPGDDLWIKLPDVLK